MPYIITTLHPWTDANEPARRARTRTAVATDYEMRAVVRDHVVASGRTIGTTADPVTNAGGSIGPLPDGTVIEVQQVSWNWIIGMADDRGINTDAVHEDGGDLAILAAFNGAT
jgi:hypothetical protein